MSGDLQAVCTRLVSRFVNLQYDGICGMSIKAGNIATDHGSKVLRAAIQKARTQDMKHQRTLRNADFSIVSVNAPSVPDASITVTAVEVFENEYEALENDERFWHGRRGHTFIMVVGPEGEWVIDDYSVEILQEQRGHSRGGSPSELARTVVMKAERAESPHKRSKSKHGNPERTAIMSRPEDTKDSLRRQARAFRRKRLNQVGLVLVGCLLAAVLYVIIAGPHSRVVSVCIYTGAKHETITLLGHTLRDRTKETEISTWILKWVDSPANTPDGHYWVPYGGWRKPKGGSWEFIDPSPTTELVMTTLKELYKQRRLGDDVALPRVEEFFGLVKPIVASLENQEGAPPLKESEQELLYLQGRMNP